MNHYSRPAKPQKVLILTTFYVILCLAPQSLTTHVPDQCIFAGTTSEGSDTGEPAV